MTAPPGSLSPVDRRYFDESLRDWRQDTPPLNNEVLRRLLMLNARQLNERRPTAQISSKALRAYMKEKGL